MKPLRRHVVRAADGSVRYYGPLALAATGHSSAQPSREQLAPDTSTLDCTLGSLDAPDTLPLGSVRAEEYAAGGGFGPLTTGRSWIHRPGVWA